MKKISFRVLSVILAVLMLASVLPMNVFAANDYKNTYKNTGNQREDIVGVAKTQVGNKNGSKYGAGSAAWCAYFIVWCARQAGIDKSIIKSTGWAAASALGVKYCGRDANRTKDIDYTPKRGDIIIFDYKPYCNKEPQKHGDHVGIVDYVKDGKVYTIEGNSYPDWSVRKNSYSLTYVDIKGYGVPNYSSSTKVKTTSSYTITPTISSVTNKTADVSVALNKTASVKKWTIFIGTSESKVKAIDGTKGSTHESTKDVTCHRIKDYKDSPKKLKSDTFTIKKYNGADLKPKTKYYYRVTASIGGKWYQSGVKSFTTADTKPSTPTLSVSKGYENVGIGDNINLSWTKSSNADDYTVIVKDSAGTEISKSQNITGTVFSLKGLNKADTYSVTVTAVNKVAQTQSNTVQFTVKDDVTVKFYDTVSNSVIKTETVHYGHDAHAPALPSYEGYNILGWDKSYTKVTEDITVNTSTKKLTYTVRFFDSFTDEVVKTQTVSYNDPATAPSDEIMQKRHSDKGYDFINWDKDFSSIKGNIDVYSVYDWHDKLHKANIEINDCSYDSDAGGYNTVCTVTNQTDETISGRIVAILQDKDGKIIKGIDATTYSTPFAVYKSESLTDATSKEIKFFIPCNGFADSIKVYMVNDYRNLGQLSAMKTDKVKNSKNSAWIYYYDDCPVSGSNIKIDPDYSVSETIKYYRFQKKIVSKSTTAPVGYTKNGYTLVNPVKKTNDYVASWPSGFLKTNKLYTTYHKSAISASETDTQKIVIDSTSTKGYIYWHWCMGTYAGPPTNRCIEGAKKSGYPQFHAFETSTALSWNSSCLAYKCSKSSVCTDTYWWYGLTPDKKGNIVIKRQNYTVYDKQYNYYSAYSEWIPYTDDSELPVNGTNAGDGATYANIETKTETHIKHRYCCIQVGDEGGASTTLSGGQTISVSFKTNEEALIDKNVAVWIYKYTQASDYTNEYVGETTVSANGEITLSGIFLAEALERGGPDYTVAVTVPGMEQAFIIGEIKAPKKQYTVTFYDNENGENKHVIKTVIVEEGDTIPQSEQPILDSSQIEAGYEFVGWKDSLVNIHSDMNVFPFLVQKKFTVVLIDWNNQSVNLIENCLYDSELSELGSPSEVEGYDVEWKVMTENGYGSIDGYKVTSNVIIVTQNTPKVFSVTIVNANYDENLSDIATNEDIKNRVYDEENASTDIDIIDTIEQNFGTEVDYSLLLGVEESEKIIFEYWINALNGERVDSFEVNQNMILYPKYEFAETVVTPEADIESGEFDSDVTVSLSCETENAVIWFTLDGSDPRASENTMMYTGPFVIGSTCYVRYYATALGYNDSDVDYSAYAINGENIGIHVLKIIPLDEMDHQYLEKPFYKFALDGFSFNDNLADYDFEVDAFDLEGMYYDFEFTQPLDFDAPITASMEIYLKYVPKQFTVSFYKNENEIIDVQSVQYGMSAEAPTPPASDEGYLFAGWDTDFDSVTEDLTVTARFITEEEYATVSIIQNGITLFVGNQTELFTEILPIYNNGYEVVWSSEDDLIASVDEDGLVTAESTGTTKITAFLPYTGATATCTVKVLYDLSSEIVLASGSNFGFDSDGNLRVAVITDNTVARILQDFENANLIIADKNGNVLSENDFVGTGCTVKLMNKEELVNSAAIVFTGDYNGDGIVNNKDVIMLNQFVLEKREADYYQSIAMDVNADGFVNNKDCAMLSRYLVGKETL